MTLLAAWTAWIDLGRFHAGTNADTVIPVLVSVLKWTPFFWEQDRYGMLVPLLATPIRHPLNNLVVQSAFTIFAGLLCFLVLARFFFRTTAWPVIAIASLGWFVVFSDAYFPYAWLSITMFYGPALVLGLGAFLVVEPSQRSRRPLRDWPRWLLALALLVLAHWVNFSIGLILMVLFVARVMGDPTRESGAERGAAPSGWKSAMRARVVALVDARLLLLASAVVAGRLIMELAPPSWRPAGVYGPLPPRLWLDAWTSALGHRDYGVGPWVTYALVPLVLGLLVRWKYARAREHSRAAPALLGIAAAALYGLGVEATKQAEAGGFPARYLVPSAGIVCVLGVGVGVASVWPLLGERVRRRAPLAVAVVSTLAVLVRFGAPSWSKVRASIDESFGQRTDELLSAGCTHVIGNYYDVWPSVFHALIRFRDAGDERVLWGIGQRASVTMPTWRRIGAEKLKLCTGKEHLEDVDAVGVGYGLPHLSVVEELSTIRVLDGDQAALREWAK